MVLVFSRTLSSLCGWPKATKRFSVNKYMKHLGCRLHPREVLTITTSLQSCGNRSSSSSAEAKRPHSVLCIQMHTSVSASLQQKLFWTDRDATKKGNSCRLSEKTPTGLLVLPCLRCILLLVRLPYSFTPTYAVQAWVCVTHCNTPKHLNARGFTEVPLLWVKCTGEIPARCS